MVARWTSSGRRTGGAGSCSSCKRARRPYSRVRKTGVQRTYKIVQKGRKLVSGLSIGGAVASGPVCIIRDPKNIDRFVPGGVLVTTTTNPDWVPIMKRAAAIVTDRGGRTSHAAIVSRELGVPAIVGTGDATKVLRPGAIRHGLLRRRRRGIRLRGHRRGRHRRDGCNGGPKHAHKDHAELGQSGSRVSLVAAAGRRGGACPD